MSDKVTVPTEIPTPAEGFALTDVQIRDSSTFLICENAQKEKKFFACGSNAYGHLGLGYNRNVTEPEEIPRPAAAEGFILINIQSGWNSTFLICENAQKEKSFLLVGIMSMVS